MDEEYSSTLNDNSEDLSEVFKALGHEGRIRIISLLVNGEHDLKHIINSTKMSKNGIVNHLTNLIDAGLVERASRGKYRLTKDGLGYIRDAVDHYLISDRYKSKQRSIDTSMYRWRIQRVDEKVVKKPAEYKPCWFSYPGAVQGVLNSHGVEVGLAEVIAVSGYGWITNAMKKNLCPSAPSAFHSETWLGIYKATERLGYSVDLVFSGAFEWDDEQQPTPEAVKNAKKQYEAIKEEIQNDRPVVLWGIPLPEYGIVNGYRGEDYIVKTFRSLTGQRDDPIHYTKIMAPGGLAFLKFIEPVVFNKKEVIIETLRWGYKLGIGDVPGLPEYVKGPDAYDVFIKNLTEEKFDDNSYHGTAYTLACLMESKWAIAEYLKQVDSVVEPDLSKVYSKYNSLYLVLKECSEVFPMGPGKMGPEKCNKVAELLKDAKKKEVGALEGLKNALNSL